MCKEKKQMQKGFLLKPYFAKYKFAIAVFILLNVVASCLTVFETIIIANFVTQLAETDTNTAIITGVTIIALIFVLRLCWYFLNIIFYKYSRLIMTDISSDIAKQMFKFNTKTFSNHGSGIFVQRVVSDPEKLIVGFSDIIFLGLDIMSYFAVVIYIAFLNIYLSIGIVVLVVIGFILEKFKNKQRAKNMKAENNARDEINSITTEIVKSEKDIKSLNLESKLNELSVIKYSIYNDKAKKKDIVNCNFWASRNAIIDIGMWGLLILGICFMDAGMIAFSTLMIIFSWRGSVYQFVFSYGAVATVVTDIKVSYARIKELFEDDEFEMEKFGNIQLENVKGDIEFKKVDYSYREYSYETSEKNSSKKDKNKKKVKTLVSENKIFTNLSFKIKHNTTVAFVGKSGSGKSTILNLISKMYETDDGEVLIDGVDVKTLTKETLRNSISLVNQFPYIFDMSIKENLLLAKKDATDEEIEDVLKKSSLKEFVDSLKQGVNTKVGESGIKLSGGQRQRLAIARAILKQTPITIFDESTSSLDNFTQQDIQKSIDELKGKSTIIIVAHRLSTIKNVDKIYFLEEGKIVDSGTFDELFNRNKKFKAMFLAENI